MPAYHQNGYSNNHRNTYRQTASGMTYVSRPQSTSCCERDDQMEGLPLAMAYVPWQMWKKIYSVEKALHRGTIFEELDKPFEGIGGCNR